MKKIIAAILLCIEAAAATTVAMLLWHLGNQPKVLVVTGFIGIGMIALLFIYGRLVPQRAGAAIIAAGLLGCILLLSIIAAPRLSDRRSSWNEAVRAMTIVQDIVAANRQYAPSHQGSFARSLTDLEKPSTLGNSYSLTYEAAEDHDHVVRHYSIRAIPGKNYWISIYADETGVIRINENGPADKNSRAIL